jgi:hypothetical protein
MKIEQKLRVLDDFSADHVGCRQFQRLRHPEVAWDETLASCVSSKIQI